MNLLRRTDRTSAGTRPEPTARDEHSRLVDCELGCPLRLVCVDGDPAVSHRLAQLGLRCGAHVTAVQRTAGGGRVVASGDVRIALDKACAAALRVAPAA